MPEYFEANVDKFIFRVATDRSYSTEGIWVLAAEQNGGLVKVGLTDFLQQRNGDVAFVYPKALETKLAAGDIFAEMETIKATLDLVSPISGEIVEVNAALETMPEIINQDPYGKGWVAVIQVENWETERTKLLDPSTYFLRMQFQAEEELNG